MAGKAVDAGQGGAQGEDRPGSPSPRLADRAEQPPEEKGDTQAEGQHATEGGSENVRERRRVDGPETCRLGHQRGRLGSDQESDSGVGEPAQSRPGFGFAKHQQLEGDGPEGERESEEMEPPGERLEKQARRSHRAEVGLRCQPGRDRAGVADAEGVGAARGVGVPSHHPPLDEVGPRPGLVQALHQLGATRHRGAGDQPAARRVDVDTTPERSHRLREGDPDDGRWLRLDGAGRRVERHHRGMGQSRLRQQQPGEEDAEERRAEAAQTGQ